MNNDTQSGKSIGLSALIVSAGTLLSRIFGLIRDVIIASVFGAGRITDVFFVAYQIPSLFRKLLAEGALSSAIVPVYVDVRNEESLRKANTLASAVFTWTCLGVGVFILFGIIAAPLFVAGIAPGFIGTPKFTLTVYLTRLLFPFLLLMSGAAVCMGILHARKSYAPSAFAPVCLNLGLIISVLLLVPVLGNDPTVQVRALIVGVLVGGFFQFYVQWQGLSVMGLRLKWNPAWPMDGLKRILKMMGPMAAGLAVTQMIAFVDKIVASFLTAGNISYLYYSNRLFQFPFALVGIALGTVVLPESSEQVSNEDLEKAVETTRESLGMMTFLMIPSAVGLALVGKPLIGVLFRSENFSELDQSITAAVLLFALLGLVAYGFIRIFVSLCYSFEDTVGPLKAATLALVTNAILDVFFVWVWPGNIYYRVCGLTLAGSVAVWMQARYLRMRLRKHFPGYRLIPWQKIRRHLLLCFLMVLILIPIVRLKLSQALTVGVTTISGAGFYFIGAFLLNDPYPVRLKNKIVEKLTDSEN